MPTPAPSTLTGTVAAWTARMLRIRWLVRAPIVLYRARLGFVFGSRLLMLEHTGRKTGARRHVVLEVAARPHPGTYVVVSGFGTRAQWWRNIRADPRVRVYLGSRRPAVATARPLTGEEVRATLSAYQTEHPHAWAALKPVLEASLGARGGDLEASLPMTALELAGTTSADSRESPPPTG